MVPETTLNARVSVCVQGNGYSNVKAAFRSHIVPRMSVTLTAAGGRWGVTHWSHEQEKRQGNFTQSYSFVQAVGLLSLIQAQQFPLGQQQQQHTFLKFTSQLEMCLGKVRTDYFLSKSTRNGFIFDGQGCLLSGRPAASVFCCGSLPVGTCTKCSKPRGTSQIYH